MKERGGGRNGGGWGKNRGERYKEGSECDMLGRPCERNRKDAAAGKTGGNYSRGNHTCLKRSEKFCELRCYAERCARWRRVWPQVQRRGSRSIRKFIRTC